jgi:hypothetical protein
MKLASTTTSYKKSECSICWFLYFLFEIPPIQIAQQDYFWRTGTIQWHWFFLILTLFCDIKLIYVKFLFDLYALTVILLGSYWRSDARACNPHQHCTSTPSITSSCCDAVKPSGPTVLFVSIGVLSNLGCSKSNAFWREQCRGYSARKIWRDR